MPTYEVWQEIADAKASQRVRDKQPQYRDCRSRPLAAIGNRCQSLRRPPRSECPGMVSPDSLKIDPTREGLHWVRRPNAWKQTSQSNRPRASCCSIWSKPATTSRAASIWQRAKKIRRAEAAPDFAPRPRHDTHRAQAVSIVSASQTSTTNYSCGSTVRSIDFEGGTVYDADQAYLAIRKAFVPQTSREGFGATSHLPASERARTRSSP